MSMAWLFWNWLSVPFVVVVTFFVWLGLAKFEDKGAWDKTEKEIKVGNE